MRAWPCGRACCTARRPGWFTDDQRGWLDDKAASLTWPRHVDRLGEAVVTVAGWVPIHEPDLHARLGYGEGTFPPGRRREDDERDALAVLRTAEAEAARLLRTGGPPVAVTARPGEPREAEDLLVVSAAVDGLEAPLQQAVERRPGCRDRGRDRRPDRRGEGAAGRRHGRRRPP